jgi:hypothetical protein
MTENMGSILSVSVFTFYVNFLPNYAFLPIIYKNTKGIVHLLNLPERKEKIYLSAMGFEPPPPTNLAGQS